MSRYTLLFVLLLNVIVPLSTYAQAPWCENVDLSILDSWGICQNLIDNPSAEEACNKALACKNALSSTTTTDKVKDCTDTYAWECKCGIKLNTNVPFIGNCIRFWSSNNAGNGGNTTTVNQLTAFPLLIGGLSRILLTVILVVAFMSVVIWGVMMSASGYNPDLYGKGKKLIRGVVISIALIGATGVILRLINPGFFG